MVPGRTGPETVHRRRPSALLHSLSGRLSESSAPLRRLVRDHPIRTRRSIMNETLITLAGWLGNDVQLRQVGDQLVANFRVASTPRRYQRKTDSWVDGDTQWYSVSAWRGLADNCAQSLRRGDPVVVHGRLRVETWTGTSGAEMTSFEIDASFVGHDLARGTSQFTRTPKPEAAASSVGEEAKPAAA
jgi:single-strand DNA-binding protein